MNTSNPIVNNLPEICSFINKVAQADVKANFVHVYYDIDKHHLKAVCAIPNNTYECLQDEIAVYRHLLKKGEVLSIEELESSVMAEIHNVFGPVERAEEVMTAKSFISLITKGEAKVLTMEQAKKLVGKKLLVWYGAFNPTTPFVTSVGEILTEYELAQRQMVEGYASRAEYLESIGYDKKAKRAHTILDEEGRETFLYAHEDSEWFDELTFTCSDADRDVYFIELPS